jgi:hypothetical protein
VNEQVADAAVDLYGSALGIAARDAVPACKCHVSHISIIHTYLRVRRSTWRRRTKGARRATSVPERAENCGREQSLTGTGNIL